MKDRVGAVAAERLIKAEPTGLGVVVASFQQPQASPIPNIGARSRVGDTVDVQIMVQSRAADTVEIADDVSCDDRHSEVEEFSGGTGSARMS